MVMLGVWLLRTLTDQARDTVGMRKGTRILQAGGIILSKNRTRSSVAQMTKTTVPEVRSQYDRWKGGKESGVREVENRRRREWRQDEIAVEKRESTKRNSIKRETGKNRM